MTKDEEEKLDEMIEAGQIKNYVINVEWEGGNCYMVRRNEKKWYTQADETFPWLSENSTDEWSKILSGLFAFRSKDDALMFRLVWG